jgi:hypothetical protein
MYFSYQAKSKRAIGFLSYGNSGKMTKIEFRVVHVPIEAYAKFVVGGKSDAFPGFNG